MNRYLPLLLVAAPLMAQATPTPAAIVIAAYGDSTTAGVTSSGGRNIIIKDNEISYLQQMLQQKYGPAVRIENHGSPGALLTELTQSSLSWEQRMAQSDASIILINYAINDARIYSAKNRPAGAESPEDFNRILTGLIKTAKAHHKQVVLQQPNPLCGRAERWNLWPYVYQLNQVAQQQQVPIVRQYQLIKQQGDWRSEMSPDCIHPTSTLYKKKAEQTFELLSQHFDSVFKTNS
ncbi:MULTISPECIES: SGNH/GDSL hydrolase family protein [Pantoea]|uniref:SGNH/GDSL hydrolase family protein n=1 Tax=Pantoea TaxID=53335 RepID=UPI001F490886|nr:MULTISPECIES: SGNH/GDSL hydrolase family protein [Pantoea]UIL53689.1 SGNH/GDSL hydrolase family protein [Pantoea agglomerans]